MSRYGVTEDYEYNATHKRHRLKVWSGAFRDLFEGHALSVKDGYVVTPYYGEKIRVTCPSPRDDDNFREVDAAISRALTLRLADSHAESSRRWGRQAERLRYAERQPTGHDVDRDRELCRHSEDESLRYQDLALETRAEALGADYVCGYCLSYAWGTGGWGSGGVAPFVGSAEAVARHSERHPIGEPCDHVRRVDAEIVTRAGEL